ncbi:MAG: hypothetical protein E7255_11025 [Lachnospiraceae bacterium]|nr:hypothetical protein [Lachnospiraceae bacterium]
MSQSTNDTMLDMFLFESSQLIEQLEQVILLSDKDNCYTEAAINEIFRVMHTIKGSAAMMTFNEISELAHTVEDLFFYIREEKPQRFDCSSLSDLVLESVDFIKVELIKIKNQDTADGDASELIHTVKDYITNLKKKNANAASASCPSAYKAVIFFEEGCEMENVRAYTIIHKLQEITDQYTYYPADILDNDQSIEVIRKEGFTIYLKANCTFEEVQDFFTL